MVRALFGAIFAIGLAAAPASAAPQGNAASAPEVNFQQLAREAAQEHRQASQGGAPGSAQARHTEWQVNFLKRSWEWHLLSTKIIFLIVLLVVAFGLFVSWLQFRHELIPRKVDPNDPVGEAATYDISASMQQVSVKSKTIGAVILIFSGVFFFLYISIVYPVTVTEGCQVTGNCAPRSGARAPGTTTE